MKLKSKIIILCTTLILIFSMFSLSVFALEDGHQFTFKKEYTFEELEEMYSLGGDSSRLGLFKNHPFTAFSNTDDFVRCLYYDGKYPDSSTFLIGIISANAVDQDNYTLFLLKDGVYYTSHTEDNKYTFAIEGVSVKFDYNDILEYDSSYTLRWNDESFNTYFPEYKEPLTFVTATTSGISHIIGWIGTVISSFVLENGPLSSLLILFVIPISISAIFFGIKAIKNVIWGT